MECKCKCGNEMLFVYGLDNALICLECNRMEHYGEWMTQAEMEDMKMDEAYEDKINTSRYSM